MNTWGTGRRSDGTVDAQLRAGMFKDTGCDLHDACLTCPFSRCRYEMSPGKARVEKDAARLVPLLAEGLTLEVAARELGVSRRSVYRWLNVPLPLAVRG